MDGLAHPGIDVPLKSGTPVHAVEDGIVLFAREFAGYGNLVILEHSATESTHYAYLDTMTVRREQQVKKGRQIGTAGWIADRHYSGIHFEFRVDRESIDPGIKLGKGRIEDLLAGR